MNRQFERYLKITLIGLDLIILNSIYVIAEIFFSKTIATNYLHQYLQYLVIANGLWLLLSFICQTYAGKIILNFNFFTKRTVQVYLLWCICILVYLFFTRELIVSRLYIFITLIGFGLGLFLNRFLYLGIKKYFRARHNLLKRVLILGYNETAKKLSRYFEEDGFSTRLVGFVEDEKNLHELSHYPILSDMSNALQIARDNKVEEIFSTITPEQNNDIYALMYAAEKEFIRFKIVPNLSKFINQSIHVDYFRDLPILSLRSEPLDDVGNRLKKRILDVIVSSLVIIFILSWMIPILGLLIFIGSRGPIFFSQKRTGKNNTAFNCLKFRSMQSNNKDSDVKQATKGDVRITRIGKFIRKTSLDEFPQFLNVFKGEMSVVGPRPHMLKHTDDYSKTVNQYMIRQFLKPGITGWAQIHGFRGEIKSPEQIESRVNKDLWYLENWTLWLDIQIMFLTIYQIIRGDEKAF
ncbi:MAG: undecaprenyl-phosphate glucose phosphotransferase [Bacteroidota bacterium]|nr:undecaprenyl-phosphate glucose phosphotransferase [Bacteroidota bacterium]